MIEELEARIVVLQAENAALLRENARLVEELRQAREDADAYEARAFAQAHNL